MIKETSKKQSWKIRFKQVLINIKKMKKQQTNFNWYFILLIDGIFQINAGYNFLGYPLESSGRVSSFFGKHDIIECSAYRYASELNICLTKMC